MKTVSFLLFVLLLLAAAGFLLYLPYGPAGETFVDIPTGTGTAGIASRLQQAGVIRSRFAFILWRHFNGGILRAGEYRFDHPAKLGDVYTRIARGDVYTVNLVIPEGYNIFDIAEAAQKAGLGSAADLLAAERRDTRLIAGLKP